MSHSTLREIDRSLLGRNSEYGKPGPKDDCPLCGTLYADMKNYDRGCRVCRPSDAHREMTRMGLAKLSREMGPPPKEEYLGAGLWRCRLTGTIRKGENPFL